MVDPIRIPPTPALRKFSEGHGFAPELVARWGEFYPDLKGLLEAMRRPAPTYLRLNGLRRKPADTLSRLREKGFELTPGPVPGAYRIDSAPFSPGASLEYLLGDYTLQDLSSQIAAAALDARPGSQVADLCAAPGGKTIAAADRMRNEGLVAAWDPDDGRHQALRSNLARCGVLNTITYQQPGQSAARWAEAFDQVLLDAPCSGEGVVARDPGRRRGQLQEFAACARDQEELVDVAWKILKPGGTLLYATCTLAPEENEFQVQRAVQTGRFEVVPLPSLVHDLRMEGRPLFPGLQRVAERELDSAMAQTVHILPHLHGALGFYLARLRKVAA